MSGRGTRGRGLSGGAPGASSIRGRGLRKQDGDTPGEGPMGSSEPSQQAAPPAAQAAPGRGRGRGLSAGRSIGQSEVSLASSSGHSASSAGGLQEPAPSTSSETPSIAGSSTGLQTTGTGRGQGQSVRGRGRGRGLAGRSATAADPEQPAVAASQSAATASGDSTSSRPKEKKEDAFNLASLAEAFTDLPKVGHNSFRDFKSRGTKGTPIKLTSNCYGLDFPDAVWHKYDVEIHRGTQAEAVELENLKDIKAKDRIASRGLNREILLQVFSHYTDVLGQDLPAYDGRKILILNRKPFGDDRYFTVSIKTPRNRSIEFTVRLKHTLDINVGTVGRFYKGQTNFLDPEVIQAVNIVVDTSFLNREWVAVNRSYYDPGRPGKPLGGGKELREGIYTSAMFADWMPLLIVDKARTAFSVARPLIDYACEVLMMQKNHLTSHGLNVKQVDTLKKEVKSLMVKLEHSHYGRTVKIAGITKTPVNRTMFTDGDGKQKSVADYFAMAYPEMPLRYPCLQCIEVTRANGSKTDYFPIEVCIVKRDQPSRKKLNPDQTANMIKSAQEKPDERMRFSRNSVKTITPARELSSFGLRLSDRPVETEGKTLNSPGILVRDRNIPVETGGWRLPEFHRPAPVDQWVVVDCAGLPRNCVDKLANLLKQKGENLRIPISNPIFLFAQPDWTMPVTTRQMLEDVKQCHRDPSKPLLAVMILGRDSNYPEIKSLTETEGLTARTFHGIVTQCVKAENVANHRKLNMSFVDNLFKKINAKLGGVNSIVKKVPDRFKEDYMVLGADVSHPSPGDFMTPSIAAVVGSMDKGPSSYCTEICVQCSQDNNRIEYIVNLRAIALKLLKAHLDANNNQKPKHIYYLRDGVSEGQFEEVRLREVTAIRYACYDLQPHYQPAITVLIAQKRHHVRFSVVDPRTGTRSGNVPPGTYIDTAVVHAKNHDLYMYTHEGLIGTSRPTHYQVIHADKPISTDEVTEMIYYLTHSYVRASKSVSIPAPIYYAHLAAFRAKEHVKADPTLCGSSAASTDSDNPQIDLKLYQKACEVNEATKHKLYFA